MSQPGEMGHGGPNGDDGRGTFKYDEELRGRTPRRAMRLQGESRQVSPPVAPEDPPDEPGAPLGDVGRSIIGHRGHPRAHSGELVVPESFRVRWTAAWPALRLGPPQRACLLALTWGMDETAHGEVSMADVIRRTGWSARTVVGHLEDLARCGLVAFSINAGIILARAILPDHIAQQGAR